MTSPEPLLTKPVGGYHGVTVEFPTLQMNLAYEEGKISPDRGYPRFVQHPDVRRLEEQARQEYHGSSALAFTSVESCLYVVLENSFNKDVRSLYVGEGLPKEIYKFLVGSAGTITPLSPRERADVAIINIEAEEKLSEKAKRRFTLGFSRDGLEREDYSLFCDAIIFSHPTEAAGILVLYTQDYEAYHLLRRHTGFNLSSRRAQRLLNMKSPSATPTTSLSKKIASLEKTDQENCLLYPSGMAAIFSSITACWTPQRQKLVMLGYAYVDTLCILEKWPARRGTAETAFIDVDDIKKLEDAVDSRTAAVISEIPTNPLLRVPDLEKAALIAHEGGSRLIVDSTIATPYNINPFDYEADIVVHSTTKFLNGLNNHMGGVVLTRDPMLLSKLTRFQSMTNAHMDQEDAVVLEGNLEGFNRRMETINANAAAVARYLSDHPKIRKVYYPTLEDHPDRIMAGKYMPRGCSGVVSFVLKQSNLENAEAFYDNLGDPVIKGPSLGAEQSLLCPYTILAHYKDSAEKRARMGLDFYLFRISVGTESLSAIIEALGKALECAN
ncbi:MAG: PLP-dependent aspartate aminotransferase family protein [archaeon]